jgi:hypothetical protein
MKIQKYFLVVPLLIWQFAFAQESKGDIQDSTSQKDDTFVIDSNKITDMGVAVAPSTMRFHCKPGKTQKMNLTLTNDTYQKNSFKLTFSDVTMNGQGKISPVPTGQYEKFGLSKYVSASSNFVELMPGEQKKVEIIVTLPDEPNAYFPYWGLLMVDEVKERDFIVPDMAGQDGMGMGVIPTYGFGIYIYQNPPNVSTSKVEIDDYNFNADDETSYVYLKVKNVGDGIGTCKAYIDLNNFNTGKTERLQIKTFNVMPGASREMNIQFPGKLPSGHYSAMLVLDFGSDEELEAAEIEFDK